MKHNQNEPYAMATSKVSIVVPAYNEEDGLGQVLEKVKSVVGDECEVIVVDDASTDRTYEITQRAGVRVVRHRRNRGYGAALKTGIRAASGEVVVTMDADGQHNPEDIPELVSCLDDSDMVSGVRSKASHSPWVRRPGKLLLGVVANFLAGMNIPDLNCGFRAIKKDIAVKFFPILPDGFSFSTTMILALLNDGYEVKYLPVTTLARTGKSTVNPITDGMNTLLLIIRMIVLFAPLKVFVPASIALFLLGSGYFGWAFAARGLHIPAGAVVLLLTSVIIFFFGILADQISAIRRGLQG